MNNLFPHLVWAVIYENCEYESRCAIRRINKWFAAKFTNKNNLLYWLRRDDPIVYGGDPMMIFYVAFQNNCMKFLKSAKAKGIEIPPDIGYVIGFEGKVNVLLLFACFLVKDSETSKEFVRGVVQGGNVAEFNLGVQKFIKLLNN